MATLFTFIILAYGWTNIMVFGTSIIQIWREFWQRKSPNFLGKLFSCPMCLGTWVGFLLSFIFQSFGWDTPISNIGAGVSNLPVDVFIVTIFLDGIFTSGAVWILHNLEEMFERLGSGE